MATIKDVALECGLTVTTVSRVLNNRGYISEQTRKKVYEAMDRLNYRPNEMARSLSKQTSNTIGVIVPHIAHPYFAKMISSLEQAAYLKKYKLLLLNSKGRPEREEEYLEICRSNRVAGLILFSGSVQTEKFRNLGFPLITLERFMDEGTAGIECDNYGGGVLAVRHLIEQGSRHLLNFGSVREQPMPADERTRGFEETCREAGAAFVSLQLDPGVYDEMNYYSIIRKTLDEHPETDGIFTSSDVIAAQVIQVCAERGIRIPDQMRVVGFDDVDIASLTVPGITTIRQPAGEMAEAAVSLIVQAMSGKEVPSRNVFPVTLVKRGST